MPDVALSDRSASTESADPASTRGAVGGLGVGERCQPLCGVQILAGWFGSKRSLLGSWFMG